MNAPDRVQAGRSRPGDAEGYGPPAGGVELRDASIARVGRVAGPADALFATLVDLLPDYFYVSDSAMRVVYVNKTAADYFGLAKENIVGKTFAELESDQEFARKFMELGREILAAGEPRVTDVDPYAEPDGTQSYYRRYDIPFRHPVTGEPMLMGLAQDMTDRVERERQARRIAAIQREMEIAHDIQRTHRPAALGLEWVDLAGFSAPAAYAGGDFYDWLRTPDGSVVVALGDVSGHGVGPALVAAECRAYWRVLAPSLPLTDAVTRLNGMIADDLPGDRFVTLAAARLSPDGTLEVFSAAHGPLAIRRADGAVELLDSHTLPLGVTADLPREEATTRRLKRGDSLLLFSDGVTDTRDRQGRTWGTSGLLDALAPRRGLKGGELMRAIDEANLTFADGVPPEDDRTVVAVTYGGAAATHTER